jgi:MFS transporter, ACS family, tartrate transporter
MLLYFVAFLDEVNISFAAFTINRDLRTSETVYGWGNRNICVGCLLSGVRTNLALARVGAGRSR